MQHGKILTPRGLCGGNYWASGAAGQAYFETRVDSALVINIPIEWLSINPILHITSKTPAAVAAARLINALTEPYESLDISNTVLYGGRIPRRSIVLEEVNHEGKLAALRLFVIFVSPNGASPQPPPASALLQTLVDRNEQHRRERMKRAPAPLGSTKRKRQDDEERESAELALTSTQASEATTDTLASALLVFAGHVDLKPSAINVHKARLDLPDHPLLVDKALRVGARSLNAHLPTHLHTEGRRFKQHQLGQILTFPTSMCWLLLRSSLGATPLPPVILQKLRKHFHSRTSPLESLPAPSAAPSDTEPGEEDGGG